MPRTKLVDAWLLIETIHQFLGWRDDYEVGIGVRWNDGEPLEYIDILTKDGGELVIRVYFDRVDTKPGEIAGTVLQIVENWESKQS